MEHYRCVFLLSLLCLTGVVLKFALGDEKESEEDDSSENQVMDVFTPTSEWQPLKKDQAIPRGLHVRVNMATGEREAKLLSEDDSGSEGREGTRGEKRDHGLSLVQREEPEVEEVAAAGGGGLGGDEEDDLPRQQEMDMSELKRVMQKMMEEGLGEAVSPTQEEIERVKSKFRSYSELKKELRKLEADVKTDAEILEETLAEYRELAEDPARDEGKRKEAEEQLLNFFEYLVHQIDNAQAFILNMNGYRGVILPSLNSSQPSVRTESLRLLASSAQNNPKVQRALVHQGAVPVLLRILSSDPSAGVKTSALYGLSCLIRGFPAGQAEFLEKGGLSILIRQFKSDASEELKRQMKAVEFIRDLLEEGREAAENESNCEGQSCAFATVRAAEYRSLKLSSRLDEEGWCEALLKLLMRHPQDNEVVEEISREMLLLARSCSKVYRELAGNSPMPTAGTEAPWLQDLRETSQSEDSAHPQPAGEPPSSLGHKDEL